MMKLRITSILCLVLSLCSCIKETVHVNGVTLDASALTIAIGDKDKLVATISPSDADNQLVLWSSSDAAVVRVNTDGEISAVAPGQAEITAKSDDGGYTAKCVVTVPEVYVPVKSITLNTEQISLNKGDTASIEANVIPDNATNPALRWMSTDESIATVDTKGTINALAPGKATIIATAEADGRISVSCAVIVEQHVGEIALNKYSLELKELEHETLEVEIKPEDAVDKSVSWKSSDETVAKVTDGTVYAMKAGEAVITATSNDGGKSVDCKVTVTCDVAGVTLSEHELKLIVDESRTLEASVYPSNASNQKLTWTSSKSAVAVVDETGKITAIAPGETLITVRTEDQGKEDNCTVIVDYEVQGVTLSEHNVVVSTGRTLKLSASVKPDNAKNKKLEWTSDAPKVATVSDDGTITGIAPGTAKITVKTAEGGYMDECTVKVEFEVKGVKLDEHSITIATGHTMKLHASVYPADAANKDLAWTSSANDVAEVSQDGIVSAKKPGTAKVTVKTREGDYMDECIVTVDYEVRNVTLSEHNITLSTGHTFTLTASVYPADAANQGLEWSSSAPAVASVSDNGVVTGKAPGEATITVKTKEGAFSDICSVRVEFEVKSVTLSEHNITLDTGKSVKLNATVQPSTAANKSLTWTSDRPDVAAVSPEGVVTAKTPGTARISVSTAEGGFTDDCSVTVDYEVKSVALSEHNITLATGKTVKLGVAVSPSTASNKAVSWSSSDTSVAEVSDDGTVTAKAPGKAVITVTTAEGGRTDNCNVQVEYEVKGVYLLEHDLTVSTGTVQKLVATVLPSTAVNQNLHWESDKPDVVSVSAEGVYTAHTPGVAVIKVTTDEGAFSDKCTIHVLYEVTGVTVSEHNITLDTGKTFKLSALVLPSAANNQNVKWESSNPSVAEVAADGTVTGIAPGDAVIKVTTDEGGFTDECKVTVKYEVRSVALSEHNIKLKVKQSLTLVAKVLPPTAVNQNVKWESSNPSVAEVAADGTVTGIAPGDAVIKVTTDEGGFTDECKVIVNYEVRGVALSEHNIKLKIKQSLKLDAKVLPPTAVNQNVKWESNNISVAEVAADGTVTGKAKGEAIITVTTDEGGFTDQCKVTVDSEVTDIKFKNGVSKLEMVVGGTETLEYEITPPDASNQKVNWTSSNKNVADVTDGVVTAKKPGEAIICATTEDGGKHALCTVSVRQKITGVAVTPGTLELRLGEDAAGKQLSAAIEPDALSYLGVTWSVAEGDEEFISVTSGGKVTPKKRTAGKKAKVIASTVDGVSGICEITVVQPVTGISVSPASFQLWEGESKKLEIKVDPADADDKTFEVKVSKKNMPINGYLSFDTATSTVTALNQGGQNDVTLSFIPNSALSSVGPASCTIDIWAHVKSVAISDASGTDITGGSKELSVGVKYQLTASVTPSNAHNPEVQWSSSKPAVVSVDANTGMVEVKGVGEAVITATSVDNPEAKASCTIKGDHIHVKSISVTEGTSTSGPTIKVGGKITLTAVVLPENAYDKSVRWVSVNEAIAKVGSNSGEVEGVAQGTTTIRAICNDNESIYADCRVTVEPLTYAVTGITLSKAEITDMKINDKDMLIAYIQPTNATNKNLTWSSSNPAVVSVDKYGQIEAHAQGTATITVTTEEGGFTASCVVTVLPPPVPVSEIELSQKSLILTYGRSVQLNATVLPEDAADKSLTWSSSNSSVVSVDSNGMVKAGTTAGTATITVKSVSDPTVQATCTIQVVSAIVELTGVKLDASVLNLYVRQPHQFTVTYRPVNASVQSVKWSVSQGGGLSVSDDGVVVGSIAGGAGMVTVTVTDVNGNVKQANCAVSVKKNDANTLTLSQDVLCLKVGETFDLTSTLIAKDPEFEATNMNVIWSSSDSKVVTVSQVGQNSVVTSADKTVKANTVGRVLAVGAGTTTITVKSRDNGALVATCNVEILAEGATPGGNEGVGFDNWNF